MKTIFKYIFFFICFGLMYSNVHAKTQKKKKAKTTEVAKKKNNSKKAKKSTSTKKLRNTQKANLISLIKEVDAPNDLPKQDSIPEKTITILSAFKPQLKNLAKIDFNSTSLLNDTSTLELNYQIPSQNLNFEYRPIALIPRSIKLDSLIVKKNLANIQIGYGNNLHDFEQIMLTTTDQKSNTHSLIVNNESFTGINHHLQIFRDFKVHYVGDFKINSKNSIQSSAYYNDAQKYRYGLVPDSSNQPLNNFSQQFNNYGLAIGWLHNEDFFKQLHLNPTLSIDQFNLNTNTSNFTLTLNNPMYYTFKNGIVFNMDNYYKWTSYKPLNTNHQESKILRLDPGITINIKGFLTNFGASQVWNKKDEFKLYPNMHIVKKLNDTNYTVSAGWRTNVEINGLSNLIAINPWIVPYNNLQTTTDEHKYIKIAIKNSKRLNYSFTIESNDYRNLPLFNRTVQNEVAKEGLKYQVIYEARATTLDVKGDLNYQFSDKILLQNTLRYTQFNLLKQNSKPWGILPLEIKSALQWSPSAKWNVQAMGQFWTGASEYRDLSNPITNKNVLILNASFTYKLSTNWHIWAKGENLLDKPYERWADYPSLGVQLIGGVIYSFRN